MDHTFYDYFRCPESTVDFRLTGNLSQGLGYFRFGEDVTCYGQSCVGDRARKYDSPLCDISSAVKFGEHIVELPFDPDDVTTNLRCESYAGHMGEHKTKLPPNRLFRGIYYLARPHMSVRFRRILQRISLRGQTTKSFPHWPVDRTVDRMFESLMTLAIQSRNNEPVPFIWFWPDGAQAALILTHDVEAEGGKKFCSTLMDLDDEFGFKSSCAAQRELTVSRKSSGVPAFAPAPCTAIYAGMMRSSFRTTCRYQTSHTWTLRMADAARSCPTLWAIFWRSLSRSRRIIPCLTS